MDANVTQQGISSTIDGFSDFFGQLGNAIGGGVIDYTKNYVGSQLGERFPERAPPMDYSNGSTGSPVDTAVNEVNSSEPDKTSQYIKYGMVGVALIAGIGTLAYIVKS